MSNSGWYLSTRMSLRFATSAATNSAENPSGLYSWKISCTTSTTSFIRPRWMSRIVTSTRDPSSTRPNDAGSMSMATSSTFSTLERGGRVVRLVDRPGQGQPSDQPHRVRQENARYGHGQNARVHLLSRQERPRGPDEPSDAVTR